MSMRITGGNKSGLRLNSFPKSIIRPTRDIVREAVFNTLGEKTAGTNFLDLFAGTGSIGIEALSRGASKSVFIEIEMKAIEVIKKNLMHTGFESFSYILKSDYQRALKKLAKDQMSFNIIYCDPPYASEYYNRCIQLIDDNGLLSIGGILIVESFKKSDIINGYANIKLIREKLYGETKILYYTNTNI